MSDALKSLIAAAADRALTRAEAETAFEPLFARLGIRIVEGKVTLQQQGPEAELRRQFLHSTAL